jgi:hypothetical protein
LVRRLAPESLPPSSSREPSRLTQVDARPTSAVFQPSGHPRGPREGGADGKVSINNRRLPHPHKLRACKALRGAANVASD